MGKKIGKQNEEIFHHEEILGETVRVQLINMVIWF
jgi:hypothetical protein